MSNESPGALVLAAGLGSRFGGDKLAAKLPNGKTILQQTLEQIRAATNKVAVVIRDSDTKLISFLQDQFQGSLKDGMQEQGVKILPFNHVKENVEQGIGSSIAYGISKTPHWGGWLICLADMPAIEASIYQQLLTHITSNNIVVPHYQGKRGNPIGFSKHYFHELINLKGDTGGKGIIQTNPTSISLIDITKTSIFFDIDSKNDLNSMGLS